MNEVLKCIPYVISTVLIILASRVMFLTIMTARNDVVLKYKEELNTLINKFGKRVYRIKETELHDIHLYTLKEDSLLKHVVENNLDWFEYELQPLAYLEERCIATKAAIEKDLENQHSYVVEAVKDIAKEIEDFKYLTINVSYNDGPGRRYDSDDFKYTVDQLKSVLDEITYKPEKGGANI